MASPGRGAEQAERLGARPNRRPAAVGHTVAQVARAAGPVWSGLLTFCPSPKTAAA